MLRCTVWPLPYQKCNFISEAQKHTQDKLLETLTMYIKLSIAFTDFYSIFHILVLIYYTNELYRTNLLIFYI